MILVYASCENGLSAHFLIAREEHNCGLRRLFGDSEKPKRKSEVYGSFVRARLDSAASLMQEVFTLICF